MSDTSTMKNLRSRDDMAPPDKSADDCAPAHLLAQTYFTRLQDPEYQKDQRGVEIAAVIAEGDAVLNQQE